MAATRACSRASVSECAFCTHAPAIIITISACVLRTRDYYFSGEPALFPLTRPYYTSRNDKDRSFRIVSENLVRTSLQTFRRKYTRRLVCVQCGCAAIAREPDTFQQKTKTGREKKNIEEGFHFTPDEQAELFVSRTSRFDSFKFSTLEKMMCIVKIRNMN